MTEPSGVRPAQALGTVLFQPKDLPTVAIASRDQPPTLGRAATLPGVAQEDVKAVRKNLSRATSERIGRWPGLACGPAASLRGLWGTYGC